MQGGNRQWIKLCGIIQKLLENCGQEGYAEAVIDWIDSQYDYYFGLVLNSRLLSLICLHQKKK